MNKLQVFNHPSFGQVEIIDIDGKPWFGASRAAGALGYVNPRKAIIDHCRTEGVTKRDTLTDGGIQEINFISEGNLYRLITKSKLPDAEKYESWVFDEVLPTIRKTGTYGVQQLPQNFAEALRLAADLSDQKQALQSKIESDKPLVLFAESLQVSKDSVLVADLAKLLKQNGINMGEGRLFKWLRAEGYLIKSGSEYNQPSQRSMDLKIMEIKIGYRGSSDGTTKITRTPKITGKGQIYFINKFKSLQQAN